MNERGPEPPDWPHWLSATGEQGVNLLRGINASMGAAAGAGTDTPLFVRAWQQALEDTGQSPDPETAAARFSSAVEQGLQRRRKDTDAGVAALDGALQGLRKAQAGEHADWLGEAYRTARGQRREHDTAAELQEAFRVYAQALSRYQDELFRSMEAALKAFRTTLEERHQQDRFPASLQELHTLWIESAEPAYEAVLSSEDYADAFAAVQNATVRLGGATRTHAQPLLNALGIPDRAELADLQQRQGELRRQKTRNRRLEAENSLLRQEVDALRGEVRALRDDDSTRHEPPDGQRGH